MEMPATDSILHYFSICHLIRRMRATQYLGLLLLYVLPPAECKRKCEYDNVDKNLLFQGYFIEKFLKKFSVNRIIIACLRKFFSRFNSKTRHGSLDFYNICTFVVDR